jgi:hypothetical protein
MRHLFKQISASTLILSSLICILYLATLNNAFTHNVFNKDDEGWFVTMGLNIVEFGTYSTDTFPTQEWGHHGTWPPVFPAILAGIMALFGTSALPLKAAITLMALVNLMLLLRLLTRMSSDASSIATWTVVLTAASPVYFLFSHTVMTEIPFMLFCTATLLALQKSESRSAAMVAGLFASLAFFTRGYAILFLPTCVICFASQRKRPVTQRVQLILAFSMPLLISAAIWWLYTRNVITNQKLDWITATFSNGTNLRDFSLNPIPYLKEVHWYHAPSLAELSLPAFYWNLQQSPLIASITGCVIAALVFAGIWFSRNDGTKIVVSWTFLYTSFLIYSGMGNPRYWLTCFPFYLFFSLIALKHLASGLKLPPKTFTVVACLCLSVFVSGLANHLRNPDRLSYISPYWRDFSTSMNWVREHLPQDAILVSKHPHLSYYSGNRRSLMGPPDTAADWPGTILRDESEIYVIVPTNLDGTRLENAAAQNVKPVPIWTYNYKYLKKHHQLENLAILKFDPEG